jgi:hypothetical protein
MGEVLRRADELLVDWSRFGAEVRAQVEREAHQIGNVVAHSVEGAVARATTTGVDRAMAEQIGAKLASLATEISRLEGRARAASRAIADDRRGDRRVLWGVAAGVLVANALLLAILLRPQPVAAPPPAEPAKIETPAPVGTNAAPTDTTATPAPATAPAPEPAAAATSGSATPKPEPTATATKDTGSGSGSGSAADKPKPMHVPPPNIRAVKVGPPVGQPKKR